LSGNSGTVPGVNFLGTADNQSLELKANGQRILRLEPNVLGPNVISGDASNYVASGVYGATIAGGGGDSNGNLVNVGEDDRHIATVDEGGVALAAIQGLTTIVREQQSAMKVSADELGELKKQNAELRQRLAILESTVNRPRKRSLGTAR
jgi:hypothetical protein